MARRPAAELSSAELMQVCEAYWSRRDTYSTDRYNEHVYAITELAARGKEVREWATRLLRHEDYEARAKGAFLLGTLARRGLLGEELERVAAELAELARRPMGEEPKESEAVDAAVEALREIGEFRRQKSGRRARSTPRTVPPLISPEFAPIGAGFGMLEAELGPVCDELRALGSQGDFPSLRPLNLEFPDLLRLLQPVRWVRTKELWVAVASERWKTACFDGSSSGGDLGGPISALAERLHCRGVAVRSAADINEIGMYGPRQTEWGNLEWLVYAIAEDGRWEFKRLGPVQPFEETAEYEKRPVKLRFTREMLVRYCQALGVPLDPSCFGPYALLREWHVTV